jgi:hypothetical protein
MKYIHKKNVIKKIRLIESNHPEYQLITQHVQYLTTPCTPHTAHGGYHRGNFNL